MVFRMHFASAVETRPLQSSGQQSLTATWANLFFNFELVCAEAAACLSAGWPEYTEYAVRRRARPHRGRQGDSLSRLAILFLPGGGVPWFPRGSPAKLATRSCFETALDLGSGGPLFGFGHVSLWPRVRVAICEFGHVRLAV